MIAYLDTSVILRPLLGQGKPLTWLSWESAYSSELLGLEIRRVIDRLRLQSVLDDIGVSEAHDELARIEMSIGILPLTRSVLQRASLPMPTVIKSLDAIHLATAMMLRERKGGDVIFATHDLQQSLAARSLGFQVAG